MTSPRLLSSLSLFATLAIAVASISSIHFFGRVSADGLQLSIELVKLQNLLGQIDQIKEQSAERQILTAKSEETLAQLEAQVSQTIKLSRERNAPAPQIATIQDRYDDYRLNLHRALALLENDQFERSAQVMVDQVEPSYNRLMRLLGISSDQVIDSAQQANQFSNWGASATILVGSLIMGVIIRRVEQSNSLAQVAKSERQLLQAKATTLQDERALLEQRVADRTRELDDRNQALSTALVQLQAAQVELIQSEKMAALGQLIAGIAHEINTPMGAIQASVGNSNKALQSVAIDLPQIETLPIELRVAFFDLLHQGMQPSPTLSSLEKRPLRNQLNQALKAKDITVHPNQVDRLIDIGLRAETVSPILPLLQSSHQAIALQFIYNLNRLQHNNRTIQMAVERAGKIVFALKSYAHSEQSQAQPEAVCLTDGIETVLELFQNLLKRGIRVQRDYQPLPPITCYADELMQVWTNLIHNAIQAMDGQGTLTIATQWRDDRASVEIRDTGPGIPVEIQDKILKPFFTTKPRGEGSGLGLSICRGILDRHQGKLEVESQPGKTTFTVLLPSQGVFAQVTDQVTDQATDPVLLCQSA